MSLTTSHTWSSPTFTGNLATFRSEPAPKYSLAGIASASPPRYVRVLPPLTRTIPMDYEGSRGMGSIVLRSAGALFVIAVAATCDAQP